MIPGIRVALALAMAILFGALSFADSVATVSDSLRRGASGIALTAVEGNRIEEIPLTFLGTYEDFAGPGYDIHLVQLEGPLADRVGVAAGMSGSPVYFDGQLIGALAYRMGLLPREAVAGVTPIDQMLSAARAEFAIDGSSASMSRPIATPLNVGGLVPEVRDWMRESLDELGFVMVGGGAATAGDAKAEPLRPGSPVGIELVRGDTRIGATGTVTWVDGDRVYAFGHPFLGSGRVEMPMVSASVVHTVADLAGSVKLASLGTELGAIVEDRLTAVVGLTGKRASMIPVELRLGGADYPDSTFRFEVVRNTRLAPLLTAAVVANSLIANAGYGDEATLRVSGMLRLHDLPDLPLDLSFAGQGPTDPSIALAVALRQTMGVLWTNPFSGVDVESMSLDVSVRPELIRYQLESLRYDRGPVRSGEEIEVTCVLRRYRGARETRKMKVRVPDDIPSGIELTLYAGSPAGIEKALGQPLIQRLRSAADLDAVVRALAARPGADRLTLALTKSMPGVVSRGVAYENLPPTAERLLGARAGSGNPPRIRRSILARSDSRLDGPVDGELAIRLEVDGGAGGTENVQ